MNLENKKKYFFSFVMGRLSNKIGGYFQHFPIDNWQNELKIARRFGFNGTEWIISDFSNPIFNDEFIKIIIKKLKENHLRISSISLDLIMQHPLHYISDENMDWLIRKLEFLQKKIKIPRISIPIEEQSRYKNNLQKNKSLKNLFKILKRLSKKSKICIETDIPVKDLEKILKRKSMKKLGLLVDIGNIRANGYEILDYINKFKEKIFGIHIKYRPKSRNKVVVEKPAAGSPPFYRGKSKLIKKNFYELKSIKLNLYKLKNLNDITFQTFRSNRNFLNDMKKNLRYYYETKAT